MAILLRVFLLFILATLALRALGRLLAGIARGVATPVGAAGPPRSPGAAVKMAKDPVCGTFVVPGKAPSATSGGDTVWFCSETCREAFARRH